MKRRTARAADRTVVLVATVLLAANTYKFPSQAFWDDLLRDRQYLLIVLLLLVGVFGALMPVETWTSRNRTERAVAIRAQILSGFGRILELRGGVQPPISINDMALHVWRRRRTIRHPIQGVLPRVATYRLGTNPVNRPFTPTKGVGVVGLCWKLNQEFSIDVEKLNQSISSEHEFDQYRQTRGADSVMNLNWSDFQRVRHRGAVFAWPIRNGRNKFVGCISFDATRGYDALNQDELHNQKSALALVIGQASFEVS